MVDLDDIKLQGLREENAHLKNKIKVLRQKLCGESGHRMKHFESKIDKEVIPIFRMLEDGKIEVRSWQDVADYYICEKCGFVEYKWRTLPNGYFRDIECCWEGIRLR